MTASFHLVLDTTAPGGVALALDGGAAYSTDRDIVLGVSTTDSDTTGYTMKVWGDVDLANDADVQDTEGKSSWITYDPAKVIKLSTGDGVKTITVRVRDDVWNASGTASDTITLDTTVPVADITVAVSPTKISKVAGKNSASFSFAADSHVQAWKVKVVANASDPHTSGTQIPTTGGSTNVTGGALAASTNQAVTIKGADLETAGAEGDNLVKVFVEDDAGNWSL